MSVPARTGLLATATLLAATAAAVSAPALGAAAADPTGGPKLSAAMTGAAEAPGPGDPDGSGLAHLAVNPGHGRVCFTLAVEDIDPARAAHVHRAPVGVAGPVVITLAAPAGGSSSGCVLAGTTREAARQLARDLIAHPEEYYVNVHNAAFPSGAVRGQLSKGR